jgi:hypothetical protein
MLLVTPPANPPLFGRVTRIHRLNLIEVDFDLGLGVHSHRKLLLDGYTPEEVPLHLEDKADHCMIVLVGGGKNVVGVNDGRGRLRLLLNERFANAPEHAVVKEVPGLNATLLDVALFFKWVIAQRCDVSIVKAVLNGKPQ